MSIGTWSTWSDEDSSGGRRRESGGERQTGSNLIPRLREKIDNLVYIVDYCSEVGLFHAGELDQQRGKW